MPPRLSKRQQRELEEVSALAAGSLAKAESEPEEEETMIASGRSRPSKAAPSAFSLLAAPNENIDEEDDEEDAGSKMSSASKRKHKKKKKKPSAAAPAADNAGIQAGPEPPSTPQPRLQKQPKADKKGKGRAKPVDDLDQALAELSLKYSDINPITSKVATSSTLQTFCRLLQVEPKYLDPDAEMRRFFGNKVINSAEGSKAQARAPTVRSVLTRPKKMWPPASMRNGLSLRPLAESELPLQSQGGEKWFTVEHSSGYRYDQGMLLQAIEMLDPNNLFAIWREVPWHVDTLMQIADVFRQQDDHSSSSDTIERAIFAYEKAFGSAFNVTTGACRLDFRRIENRAFFLAIHRTILHLERRGCMRTAFEFARLLWALDPWTDPHGALLHLDFLVPKTREAGWASEVEKLWESLREKGEKLAPLQALPGWCWSRALTLKESGDEAADEALKTAMIAHPEVVTLLATMLGVGIPSNARAPVAMSRWDDGDSSGSTIHLCAHIYANRSISLWKPPETLAWFTRILQQVAHEIGSSTSGHPLRAAFLAYVNSSPSVIKTFVRHAIVSDIKVLIPFMGPLTASAGQYSYDLVPPSDPYTTSYDDDYFSGASPEPGRGKAAERAAAAQAGRQRVERIEIDPVGFLEMLEGELQGPDPEVRARLLNALTEPMADVGLRPLEQWIRQNQAIEAQYPNAARFLLASREERRRLLQEAGAGEAGAIPGGGIHAPGGYAGDVLEEQQAAQSSDETDEDEDTNGEGEAAPILPVRLARGIMNLFWGQRTSAPEESSEDDGEDLP